jgi:hypothetical protein
MGVEDSSLCGLPLGCKPVPVRFNSAVRGDEVTFITTTTGFAAAGAVRMKLRTLALV